MLVYHPCLRLGKTVGSSPWVTIFISLVVCGLCLLGFLKLKRESRNSELWVPKNSKARHAKDWIERHFKAEPTPVSFIEARSNVLTVDVIQKVNLSLPIYHRNICYVLTFHIDKQQSCFAVTNLLNLSYDKKLINRTKSMVISDKLTNIM